MPLQNFFLLLLVPIILYETITAYKRRIPHSKLTTYKATTWFSFFVVFQLILLVYEPILVKEVFQFSIWMLLFLFYGPFLNLVASSKQKENQEEHQESPNGYHFSEFYYMIYVFIFGLFFSLLKNKWAYVEMSMAVLLGIALLYYIIVLRKKIRGMVCKPNVDTSNQYPIRWKFLHFGLGIILVLFFFALSNDVKLSVFLLLLLVYVYLTFLRKRMEVEPFLAEKEVVQWEEQLTGEWNGVTHRQMIEKQRKELKSGQGNGQGNEQGNGLGKKYEGSNLKYGQTKLNDVVLQRCKSKVNQIIMEDKAYLDANFKMTDLAAKTKISRYYLAQYFNVIYRMNFREYINKLRIEHVVEYINNHQAKEELSVHDLFLESAFNSKTSFFKSFKHVLGCTPFEYLKKCHS